MTTTNEQTTPAPKQRRSAKPTAPKTKAVKKTPRKPAAEKSSKPARKKKKPAEPKAPRITKQACVGAALDEIVEATQWQKHTARAWLSRGGGSTQKPGPKVHRDPETGRYRQPVEYSLASPVRLFGSLDIMAHMGQCNPYGPYGPYGNFRVEGSDEKHSDFGRGLGGHCGTRQVWRNRG